MNTQVPEQKFTMELDTCDRWSVFQRLQELSIPCQCAYGQPLQVEATTPTAVMQIWSVAQHWTRPLEATVAMLENCLKRSVKS
ncbi:MAG: Asr1405/Asl0597 family protein [Leptolyngbyaceae cyanobacterium]